ncbi:DUF1289 domain-containing protein [Billgrantia montanilacus]|uniref:DUF1289 domain-containing protein n=1 Tax=Billgrantia montanilacus TaxID=2282305 RepID=A0A368TXH3_9GAMM|nr:DUF1289 domain-containing protein [Halomonas montanilacus]RCV89414.1 DUF1289 domain-containing protein [Halomonas montanilacus]
MAASITSPCVGLCSTTLGDPVCRGCQRGDNEILDWFGLSGDEREARMAELDALRDAVAGRFLRVVDPELLEAQLQRHGIRFRPEQPALSRAVELLRVGRTRIQALPRYGLVPVEAALGLDVAELHARLSQALAEAAECRQAQQQAHRNRVSLVVPPEST